VSAGLFDLVQWRRDGRQSRDSSPKCRKLLLNMSMKGEDIGEGTADREDLEHAAVNCRVTNTVSVVMTC
jgi:hypothetical protein